MSGGRAAALALAVGLGLVGLAGAARPAATDPVVLVAGGRAVRASELRSAILQIPDPPEREGMAADPARAARWYGRIVALAAAAARLRLGTPEMRGYPLLAREEGMVARLMRYLARQAEPAVGQERRYYRTHRVRFLVRQASLLLVSDRASLNPRSGRTAAAARARAYALARALRRGASFATLARQYSDDAATRARGGDLGWVSARQGTPALERVLARLRPGELSSPFRTRFGWEIVRAGPQREEPFGAVQSQIAGLLREKAIQARLAGMMAAARITLRPAALAAVSEGLSRPVLDAPAGRAGPRRR